MTNLRTLFLLSCILVMGEGKLEAKCPPSYVHRVGTTECYLFTYGTRSYTDAKTYCNRESGSSLVEVKDDTLAEWLSIEVVRQGYTADASYHWLGAKYVNGSGWLWDSDNSTVNSDYIAIDDTKEGNRGTIGTDATLRGKPGAEEYHLICVRSIDEPIYCDYEEGWHMSNNRCYNRPSSKTSFTNAVIECAQLGGDIISIDGQQENYFAYDEAERHGDSIWIGLNELNHANTWTWAGANSSYLFWADGMPQSLNGFGAAVISVNEVDGKWYTEFANNEHHYICEKPIGACVTGWELNGDSCYYFSPTDEKYAWQGGKEICNSTGAHLVTIETKDEDEFIFKKLQDDDHIWIGLSHKQGESAFSWIDGTLYNSSGFTKMSSADEQSALALSSDTCDFISLADPGTANATSQWVPVTCTDNHKFLCEIPKGSTVHLPVPSGDKFCHVGWTLEGNFCYYFSAEEKTWSNSENYCKTFDGHLSSVTSFTENDFLMNTMQAKSWIGLNDRITDGVYTFTDDSPLLIENWNYGEPSGGEENCVEMYEDNGYWNDNPCSDLRTFVCKAQYLDSQPDVVTTTEPPYSYDCGEGWVEDTSTGTCYRVENMLLAFADAQLHCEELYYSDGESRPSLVSFSNVQEQIFVESLIVSANLGYDSVFIGMKNNYNDGIYWLDGTPISYLDFNDGEPNSPYAEECIEMLLYNGYHWNDAYCTNRNTFICEKKGINYVAPTTPAPVSLCPDDWVLFNQHCYFFNLYSTYTYSDALENCAAMYNSTLVSINSADENDFFYSHMTDSYNDVWTGLRSFGYNSTFSWSDGSELRYTNWNTDQPDSTDENKCVIILSDYYETGVAGKWDDVSCFDYHAYACKTLYKTCPETWQYWNGKCYHVSEESQTWDIAIDKCKDADGGATLVSWHSQEEVNYVTDVAGDSSTGFWIGLYQDQNTLEWQWTDGTDLDYPTWSPGQPQNNTEFCGRANTDGTVEDYPCEDSYTYACESFPTHTIGCDPDWHYYKGRCYYYSGLESGAGFYNYYESKEKCQEKGSDLASVDSSETNLFLGSLITQSGSYYEEGWIGLYESESNGAILWSNGDPLTYTNFGQYTNSYYTAICFAIMNPYYDGRYLWVSNGCDSFVSFYFCEKPPTITSLLKPDNGCLQDGDLVHEASCYRSVTTPLPYAEAKANCSIVVDGGHLVTMLHNHESAYLSAYFDTLGDRSWIGLEASFNDDGSTDYKWIDSTPFTFDAWGQYEPYPNRGACVAASGEAETPGLWYVTSCTDKQYPFFCEYPREGYTTVDFPKTTAGPAYCTDGWTLNSLTDSCYKLMLQGGLTQGFAEEDCVQYGGHLVSITNELEEQFILGMDDLDKFNYTTFWTGLVKGDDGYEWLDGSPFEFQHWASGQPDSHHDREDCVTAYKNTMQLSDTYCDGIFGYMCKAPQGMSGSTHNPITNTPDVPCSVDSLGSDGWLEHDGNCYRVYSETETEALSWSEASKFCREKGSELTSVLSNEENSFILSKIHLKSDEMLWLGGSADLNSQYNWADEAPFEFINWKIGEPNNWNDMESCIATLPHLSAYWNDVNCGDLFGFICKRPVSNTVPPRLTTASPSGHCPDGWFHAADKCIKIISEQYTYDEGRSTCKSAGVNSDLVSIHGPELQAAVSAALNLHNSSAWIGMRLNDEFFWVDGSDVQYTNWSPGEPNNSGGNQKCVKMLHRDGTWDDYVCDKQISSVCMQNVDASLSTHHPLPSCPEPYSAYTNYSGNCYKAVNEPKTWQEAKEYCETEGSSLISIEGIIENNFVYVLDVDSSLSDMWIGLNSLQNPDQYTWVNNFPVVYTNWGENQPNLTNTNERCVQLSPGEAGTWFSSDCSHSKPFVCKHYEGSLPSAGPAVYGTCPDNSWLNFGSSYCYLIETSVRKSWNDANLACIQLGGNLVSIHSEDEMSLLKKAAEYYPYSLWTGLVQRVDDYGWADGSAIDFFYWADEQPSGQEEECVEMYPDSRKWNDKDCSAKFGYVCKAAKVGEDGQKITTESNIITTTPSNGLTGGLGGGAIAGIIIACLVLLTAVGLLGFSKRTQLESQLNSLKARATSPKVASSTPSTGFDNDAYPQNLPEEFDTKSPVSNEDKVTLDIGDLESLESTS